MTHPQFSFLKGKTPWKKPNAITDPPPPTGLLSAQPLDGALSFFAQADDNHFNQSFMEYNSTTGIELGSYSSEEPISLTFCRSSSPFRLDYSQLSVPEQTNYFCSLPQQTDSANEMVTNTDDTTIEVNSILDISPAAVGTDVRSSGGSFFIPPRIYDIRPGIRPVFMAIFHPYPQHANMEVEEDVGRVARWLGSIVQPACFNAFYYKPSVSITTRSLHETFPPPPAPGTTPGYIDICIVLAPTHVECPRWVARREDQGMIDIDAIFPFVRHATRLS